MNLHHSTIVLFATLLLPACVDWGDIEQPGKTPKPLAAPTFSHDSGFYDSDISVGLSHSDSTVAVYYTLDGSEPDPANINGTTYRYKLQYPYTPGDPFGAFHTQKYKSARYKHRIAVADRSKEPDRIARVSTTHHNAEPEYVTPLKHLSTTEKRINRLVDSINRSLPDSVQLPTITPHPQARLLKGTVLRSMAIKKGGARSEVVTASYFVMPRSTFQLPVVSLVAQENLLFDYDKGILVAGKTFDDFRLKHPGQRVRGGTAPANFQARGEDTPAHFQFFSDSKNPERASMNQRIGVRVHGGFSRANASKSLRLYARKRYGENKFRHSVFGEDYNHKRLILRNSGNDFYKTMFKDAAAQAVLQPLNIETQSYQPVVAFVNGEYWGILNVREYFDKNFFSEKYAIPEEDIELVENNSVIEGDPMHWNLVMNFFEKSDLRREESYQQASGLIDIDSFIDHQIANIFIGNSDWPHNNVKAWRYRGDSAQYSSKGILDGRWRWLQFDADLSMGSPDKNTLIGALNPRGMLNRENLEWSTLLLRKLMANSNFRSRFINRFADLLNTTFEPQRMIAEIQRLQDAIRPEMPRHLERWKQPASIDDWDKNVQMMRTFAEERPAIQRKQLMQQFGLASTYELRVEAPDSEQGFIRINSLETRNLKSRMGNSGTWSGIYFSGVPIELEAIAKPCYAFKRWHGIKSANVSTRITVNHPLSVRAEFEPVCTQ